MAMEIKIPQAGESITEVQIGDWHKSEGDAVKTDDILVEIETDKATQELPAPESGRLGRILKQTGDVVKVGEVIAYLEPGDGKAEDDEEESEDREEKKEPSGKAKGRKQGAAKDKKKSKDRRDDDEKDGTDDQEDGEADAERDAGSKRRASGDESRDGKALVMPAARRVMAEHGLSEADVEGTGPGGRILKEDVLRHLEDQDEAPEDDGDETQAEPATRDASGEREAERVPMTMLRRRIAERLVKAQHTAALLTTFNEIDMSAVMGLRKQFGEAFQKRHEIKLGFMSFFVKASVEALKRIPAVNAEIRGTDIVYHNYYDIGVAVAADQGLVVPVIRDADRLSFAEVEEAIADLAERARKKKLAVEELEGGTFTISNGGIYGSLMSTPIVNPPQSGILGLHAIQDRPVARDGQVVIRPMMYVALTYDHRIIDGREAVTFLRTIKELIETPARMLMEI